MDFTMVLGLVAAFCTTAALFPQLVKVYRTKSTKDISAPMFALTSTGVLLWFIYGMYMNNFPIIAANSLAFVQALVILAFKLKYK